MIIPDLQISHFAVLEVFAREAYLLKILLRLSLLLQSLSIILNNCIFSSFLGM